MVPGRFPLLLSRGRVPPCPLRASFTPRLPRQRTPEKGASERERSTGRAFQEGASRRGFLSYQLYCSPWAGCTDPWPGSPQVPLQNGSEMKVWETLGFQKKPGGLGLLRRGSRLPEHGSLCLCRRFLRTLKAGVSAGISPWGQTSETGRKQE